jgi:hypothetical protein
MDNGSGIAVVMSAMEAISSLQFTHSVCFTAFDGEELGLLGSRHIAREIKSSPKLKSNFLGAITSDMSTGFKSSATSTRPSGWDKRNSEVIREQAANPAADGIHIDGDAASQPLVKLLAEQAQAVVTDQTMPILESSASIWNSDQKAFQENGLSAVDICAANHRVYQFWHHDLNVTENLDPAIGFEISRTTTATIFSMAERLQTRVLEQNGQAAGVPRFGGSKTIEEAFGSDFECSALLEAHEDTVASTIESKAIPHTHMSLELARQLEETLSGLESRLGHVKV